MPRELAKRFRDQYGIVSRSQLYALGASRALVRRRLATGEWEAMNGRVVRLASAAPAPEQQLLGLCLAAGPGAVASHLSAAWLWHLCELPERHAITVARTMSSRTMGGDVHRPRQYPSRVVVQRGIPCTTPLRTIVDAAAVCTPDELEDVVDRALANRLVSVDGIEAELARTAGVGRPGTRALRGALAWRRSVGCAKASALESLALRLLHRAGIKPLGLEVKVGDDRTYRVDIMLRPNLAMEVDGYAFHSGPEQMTEDARRRNRLLMSGVRVLVYTWRDIAHDGHRVLAEVRHALSQTA